MKALLTFVALTSLFFTACQNDNDFAAPQDFQTAILDQTLATTVGPIDLSASCVDVKTDHTMYGNGSVISGSSFNTISVASRGTYAISGRGNVYSERLGNGSTTTRFTYNARTRVLSGVIISNFESGTRLEQRFHGTAQQTTNSNTMTLTVNLTSATLIRENVIFNLAAGNIQITIPATPIGFVAVTARTFGSYCKVE